MNGPGPQGPPTSGGPPMMGGHGGPPGGPSGTPGGPMSMNGPPTSMGGGPPGAGPRPNINPERAQKMLDENSSLIKTISEYQGMGRTQESMSYQVTRTY